MAQRRRFQSVVLEQVATCDVAGSRVPRIAKVGVSTRKRFASPARPPCRAKPEDLDYEKSFIEERGRALKASPAELPRRDQPEDRLQDDSEEALADEKPADKMDLSKTGLWRNCQRLTLRRITSLSAWQPSAGAVSVCVSRGSLSGTVLCSSTR